MNYHKGFAAVTALLIVLGIIVVGGAGYVALNPEVLKAPADAPAEEGAEAGANERKKGWIELDSSQLGAEKSSISWNFQSASEIQGTPYTKVTVTINGTAHDAGTYPGSCSEVGASGGVDGKGLLAGELSAAQCWFAGSGDEIGVFAHEDGGFDVMVGELGEPEEGSDGFRGNFEVKITLP